MQEWWRKTTRKVLKIVGLLENLNYSSPKIHKQMVPSRRVGVVASENACNIPLLFPLFSFPPHPPSYPTQPIQFNCISTLTFQLSTLYSCCFFFVE
jgi:hypothetical protein